MTHDYRVHGVPHLKDEQMPVTLADGSTATAKVQALEVVLTPVDHAGGTCVFRYTDEAEIAEARLLYAEHGTIVTLSITAKEVANG